MWIDIPTPFKRGDIVTNILEQRWDKYEEQVIVLDHLDNWDSNQLSENGFRDGKNVGEMDFKAWDRVRQHHGEGGDSSDMCYTGYVCGDGSTLYWDTAWNYLDLEYYRGKLDGKKDAVKVMSNYLKGKIDGELLAKAYHIFALRDKLKEEERCLNEFTQEALILAGLKE